MRKGILSLIVAALSLTPAAAQRIHYLDPREVTQAQRENAQIIEELGGEERGPRAAYVEAVGRRVSAYSGIANPGQVLHFTTLNSAVENAFSVPGGYVYVTRQLMSLMGDESQLAFALGHEVGHIAGDHARQREAVERELTWRALPEIMLGQMIGGGYGNSIALRSALEAKLRTLGFSREQEYEADTFGLRYMIAAGYDPAGAAQLLAQLTRETALEARVQGRKSRRIPEWALTHPLSENRMRRALQEARETGRMGTGLRNRNAFLDQIEGMYVDDDPAQGIIDGPVFLHPDYRIRFQIPTGYLMSNGTHAVTIAGSAGKAQFRGGRTNLSLDDYIAAVFEQLIQGPGTIEVPRPRRQIVNGMPAEFTTAHVDTGSGVIDVSVIAYQWDPSHIYHFVMLTRGGAGMGAFADMARSVRKLSRAEAAAIRPRVIHVVTVRPGDTAQSLAARMAYRDYKFDRFLALNGLSANSRLAPGQRVKLVVYGDRRS